LGKDEIAGVVVEAGDLLLPRPAVEEMGEEVAMEETLQQSHPRQQLTLEVVALKLPHRIQI